MTTKQLIKLNHIAEFILVAVFLALAWASIDNRLWGGAEELGLSDDQYLAQIDQADDAQAIVLSWYARLQNPRQVDARYNIALTYYRNGWTEDAMLELGDLLDINPDHVDALLLKARILGSEGNIEESNEIYVRVLDIDPNNAEARYYLGVNHQVADPQFAREQFEAAIRADPNLIPHPIENIPFGLKARLQLGRLLFNMARVEVSESGVRSVGIQDAIAVLEEAHELAPDDLEIRQQLIDCLKFEAETYQTGFRDYSKALEVYEKIVQIDPNDFEAWDWIGKINFYFLEDYEAALRAYRKAYELSPDLYLLAVIRDLEGKLADQGN